MEKRFILAFIFTFLILVAFYILFPPAPHVPPHDKDEVKEEVKRIVEEPIYQPEPHDGISMDFPLFTAFISEKGGLRNFILKDYRTRKAGIPQIEQQLRGNIERLRAQNRAEDPNLLYSIKELRYTLEHLKVHGSKKGLELISFSQIYNNSLPPFIELKDERGNTIWKEGEEPYEISQIGSHEVLLSQRIIENIKLQKRFVFIPDSYLINVTITVENIGEKIFPSSNLFIICGPDIGIKDGIHAHIHHHPVMLIDGRLERGEFARGENGKTVEKIEHGNVSWVALQDRYFCGVLIPRGGMEGVFRKNEFGEHSVGLKAKIPTLKPLQQKEFNFGLYLGPKKLESLGKIGYDLTRIMDYGFFGNLFHLIHILNFFYRLTHNYGVAIILLTLLTSMILFPLSLKSFKSMKEMRKLQPEMEKIRKQFKDDPQRMNKELVELYKRHRVNPMGGCLPMLLQMPIFIGLFTTFNSATELREAPFLWIKDLSLPDTVYTLPFSIPFLGASLNLLPLIMTGISFFQQKISGGGGSSKIMLIFPFFLLFIFYNFPSGLVLYFLCSNSINILGQLWTNRQGTKKV